MKIFLTSISKFVCAIKLEKKEIYRIFKLENLKKIRHGNLYSFSGQSKWFIADYNNLTKKKNPQMNIKKIIIIFEFEVL